VLGATETKQSSPILNSVLINAATEKIKFTATDLSITIISTQELTNTQEGQVAIPVKRFTSIVKELPSQEITLETNKNNLLIKCGKIELKMNTLPVEEFPQVQEEKGASLIKIDPQKLEEMIRLTSFCVGYEDVNYVLSGILFEITKDKIKLVSTDGKRLAFIQKTLPPAQPEIKTKISFILPVRAVSELSKLVKDEDGDVFLNVKENRVEFGFKDTWFVARTIEGEFPNYSQYIPGETKDKLMANRKELLAALRRANLFSTPDYQGVKLELKKETLSIHKSAPQLGEIKEVVGVNYSGANLEIGFNPGYLVDVLKNLEDQEVSVDFFGPDKPAVLKKEDYIYLLLPMKL
jgi:DNA polymerase-3 subunit beta